MCIVNDMIVQFVPCPFPQSGDAGQSEDKSDTFGSSNAIKKVYTMQTLHKKPWCSNKVAYSHLKTGFGMNEFW